MSKMPLMAGSKQGHILQPRGEKFCSIAINQKSVLFQRACAAPRNHLCSFDTIKL